MGLDYLTVLSELLTDIIILLVAAVIVVPLFQFARLGALPGFLVAGLIVGPSGMALIGNVGEISHFAEFGVVLLLFIIGIELKPARLWLMRRMVFGLGTLQVVIIGTVISGLTYLLLDLPARTALLVGPALALSSTAFVLQILAQQRQLNNEHGRASLAVLLFQDLAVVPLLALVPLLAMPEMGVGENIGIALLEALAILAVAAVVGHYLLGPILHRVAIAGNPELFTSSAVLIVLGTAVAAEYAGLSMAMGAFLAGLLISDSSYRHQVLAEILPFRGLLLGLFFMSMGMSVNIDILFDQPFTLVSLTVALLAVKAVILYLLARAFRLDSANSKAVALLLAQSGEFAMVLFALARQQNLLPEMLFQQLLLVVLLTMLVTPAMAKLAKRIVARNGAEPETSGDPGEAEASIVLAGFGRVGRRIGEILSQAGIPFVALDSDPGIVRINRARGHPVFNGDVCQPGILRAVGATGASSIIVTLNDPESTKEVVSSLRAMYPNTNIYARGHNLDTCRDLNRLGASGVVSENVQASLELARMALTQVGLNEIDREDMLGQFEQKYKAEIKAGSPQAMP